MEPEAVEMFKEVLTKIGADTEFVAAMFELCQSVYPIIAWTEKAEYMEITKEEELTALSAPLDPPNMPTVLEWQRFIMAHEVYDEKWQARVAAEDEEQTDG